VISQSLSPDVEMECLCYFFSNYVNIPRDPTTNIFVEHILPLYLSAPLDSSLYRATSAVAINVTQIWFTGRCNSFLARHAYTRAVSAVKVAVLDPVQIQSDELLASVFMLDFYDSLNRRFFLSSGDSGLHKKGALALIRHRGPASFKTGVSRRLFTAIRSRQIVYSLQKRRKVELEPDFLATDILDLPSARLDLLIAELANLHSDLDRGRSDTLTDKSIDSPDQVAFCKTILRRSLMLDAKLHEWRQSLPSSWRPLTITDLNEIHPSIRAAGLYNGLCDVYSSLTVSHINNASRSVHVAVLRLITYCNRILALGGAGFDAQLQDYIDEQTQILVDSICASLPYHLGSRITTTLPHEHVEYPRVPPELRRQAKYVDAMGKDVEMTDKDHIRGATALGGWFLIIALKALTTAAKWGGKPGLTALNLREGQLDWIRGQMKRVKRLYQVPDIKQCEGAQSLSSFVMPFSNY